MITVNTVEAILGIPDIGVTVRSLLGAAAEGYKVNKQRRWNIKYKEVVIGKIYLKTAAEGIVKSAEVQRAARTSAFVSSEN